MASTNGVTLSSLPWYRESHGGVLNGEFVRYDEYYADSGDYGDAFDDMPIEWLEWRVEHEGQGS